MLPGDKPPTSGQQEGERLTRAYRHRNAVGILILGSNKKRTALPELAAFAYPTTKTTASSVQVLAVLARLGLVSLRCA